MKRFVIVIVVMIALAALIVGGMKFTKSQRQQAAGDLDAIQRLDLDVRTTRIMDALRASASNERVAFLNVNVVDPGAGSILAGQTVITDGEKIEWVGSTTQAPDLAGAMVVDGSSRYLSPGLTDMHVHTEHMGQHLLRLAVGVTSVRDMDGLPWLLRTRDAINSGSMIGATTYVAGTIIADQPLHGYAVVVHKPNEARQTVRNQAACGYSFIKVHNSLSEPLLDAVADEAHRQHLDLIGHVPHDISLLHAIQSAHMRTLEHLKGFLNDRNLLPSDEPYAPAMKGAEVWLTPTLYTQLPGSHGDQAQRLVADPRQRLAPRTLREEWRSEIPEPGTDDAKSHDRLVETQGIVMARLLPLHPHWLVGTDAAGYAFNIAGFAALDEMVLLHRFGLSNTEVVRAATSEPAIAMRRPDEFGRVAVGMRADLILLASNPLADVSAYQSSLGVMARGHWYDRGHLNAALDQIAAIYATPAIRAIDLNAAKKLVASVEKLAKRSYVFEDRAVQDASDALQRKGAVDLARRLRNLLSAPATGVCAANLPN
jgi:hypothetical protein